MYDPGTLYVDPILTGFAVGYQPQDLFGERFFPLNTVDTKSARYRVFDRSDWLIFYDRREPGTVANEVQGRKWSSDSFNLREHSLQAPIWDEERQYLASLGGLANPANGGALTINPEVDATTLITRSIRLAHEKKALDTVRNTANYPGDHAVTLAGAQRWDDHTYVTAGVPTSVVSNPVLDIQTGMRKIYSKTNQWPNRLALPDLAVGWIENHPRVVDRFKGFSLTQPDAFRLLTGFDGEIFIVNSVYNSADSIDATAVMTSLWGKDAWLGYVDESDNVIQATFGKTFSWRYPDGTVRPTDRWREEPRKSDIVRVSQNYDLKIVSSTAGYILKTVIS